MRSAPFKLLTVLAVASLSTVGCGDDGDKTGDTTDTTDTTDTNVPDSSDTTDTSDTTPPDTNDTNNPPTDTTPDTETQGCGLRECGTFGNLNCGTCDPGFECNDNGRCVVPGAALGAFCGLTSTCSRDSADFPGCLDEQCDSNICMATATSGSFNFTSFRDWGDVVFAASFCTKTCVIYKDTDEDGVNDADAQDDCNPPDIVDGPAGNSLRCVNFADQESNPIGMCMPGTTFDRCSKPADCTNPNESCELTSLQGTLEGRCLTNYKSGAWGDAASKGEACNDDPEAGAVVLCQEGFCDGFGCSANCGNDGDCNTAPAGSCQGGHCQGKPNSTCAGDADCTSFECGEINLGDFGTFATCQPKGCEVEDDCGTGFSCDFRWNGSVRNPAEANVCAPYPEDGVGLYEACDPDPTDNQVVNGGAVCNTNLCLSGACSQVCNTDDECGSGNVCLYYEIANAFVACDVDEDCGAGNACTGDDGACYDPVELVYIELEDSGPTYIFNTGFCSSLEGTSSCEKESDCGADEYCDIYLLSNVDAGGAVDADAPVTLHGACREKTADGELGDECTSYADCRSGFCFPASDTFAFCSAPCTASSECGSFDVGGEAVHGYCDSYLWSYSGDLERFQNFTYLGLCVFDFGSTADCSDDFTCDAGTEACFPNVIAGNDPTEPSTVEHLCFQVWEADTDRGTKQVGEPCDPNAEFSECENGFCTTEVGDDTQGYCSALCNAGDDCGVEGLSCTELVRFPRSGAYEDNTGHFGLCLKSQECATCTSHLDCPGGLVCANLGTSAAPAYQCVPGCETADDCANATVPGACNATTDSFGEADSGCFAKTAGGAAVNYCAP